MTTAINKGLELTIQTEIDSPSVLRFGKNSLSFAILTIEAKGHSNRVFGLIGANPSVESLKTSKIGAKPGSIIPLFPHRNFCGVYPGLLEEMSEICLKKLASLLEVGRDSEYETIIGKREDLKTRRSDMY